MYCGKSFQNWRTATAWFSWRMWIVYLVGQARSSRSLLCLTVHCLPLPLLCPSWGLGGAEEDATVDGWGCGGFALWVLGVIQERDWTYVPSCPTFTWTQDHSPGDMLALSNLKKGTVGGWEDGILSFNSLFIRLAWKKLSKATLDTFLCLWTSLNFVTLIEIWEIQLFLKFFIDFQWRKFYFLLLSKENYFSLHLKEQFSWIYIFKHNYLKKICDAGHESPTVFWHLQASGWNEQDWSCEAGLSYSWSRKKGPYLHRWGRIKIVEIHYFQPISQIPR